MLIKNPQDGKYHCYICTTFTSACTFLFFLSPFSPLSLFFIIVVHMYWNCCIKRITLIERCVAHKSILTCIQVDVERHWLMYNKASHGAYSVYQLIHLCLHCILWKYRKQMWRLCALIKIQPQSLWVCCMMGMSRRSAVLSRKVSLEKNIF